MSYQYRSPSNTKLCLIPSPHYHAKGRTAHRQLLLYLNILTYFQRQRLFSLLPEFSQPEIREYNSVRLQAPDISGIQKHGPAPVRIVIFWVLSLRLCQPVNDRGIERRNFFLFPAVGRLVADMIGGAVPQSDAHRWRPRGFRWTLDSTSRLH